MQTLKEALATLARTTLTATAIVAYFQLYSDSQADPQAPLHTLTGVRYHFEQIFNSVSQCEAEPRKNSRADLKPCAARLRAGRVRCPARP